MAADLALQNKNIQFLANFKKLTATDFVKCECQLTDLEVRRAGSRVVDKHAPLPP